MANNLMLTGVTDFYDDFSGPFSSATNGLIASKCIYTVSGATVTRLAVNGGAARMTIAANDTDVASIFGPRAFEPDECGLLTMQVRIRISTSIAAASLFVGFTDSDADTVVIEDEDGTLNTVPADAFGLLLETEQDGTWQTMGVGNDVDDTQRAANNIDDPVLATWTTIKIEADNNNDTTTAVVRYRVWVDGKILKTAVTDANGWTTSVARSSIVYCPVVSADARGTAHLVDVCEMAANGGKGTTLD